MVSIHFLTLIVAVNYALSVPLQSLYDLEPPELTIANSVVHVELRRRAPPKIYTCEVCGKQFRGHKQSWKNCMQRHNDPNPPELSCICGKRTSSKQGLSHHQSSCKLWLVTQPTPQELECKRCGKKGFKSAATLGHHMGACRTPGQLQETPVVITCERCHKSDFKNKGNLANHQKSCFKKRPPPSQPAAISFGKQRQSAPLKRPAPSPERSPRPAPQQRQQQPQLQPEKLVSPPRRPQAPPGYRQAQSYPNVAADPVDLDYQIPPADLQKLVDYRPPPPRERPSSSTHKQSPGNGQRKSPVSPQEPSNEQLSAMFLNLD